MQKNETSDNPPSHPGYVWGIDPGDSGAIAIIDTDGTPTAEIRLNRPTPEMFDFLSPIIPLTRYILGERVGHKQGDGSRGSFTFGRSYGIMETLLHTFHHYHGIPHNIVVPTLWRTRVGVPLGATKKDLRDRAMEFFPTYKMTYKNCDAFLLASFALDLYLSGKVKQ